MVMLVVDDDPVSRLVAEHILRSGGHDVIGAESAEDARELASQHASDLVAVFCDYNMPGASGLDLLEQMRQDHDPCPPFVLVTGVGEADELDDTRAGLVTSYLTKPVQSGEVLALADRLASEPLVDCAD